MYKGQKKKEHRQKIEKRNKEIRKAQMQRVNTLTNNIQVFEQVMKEFAEEMIAEAKNKEKKEGND